MSAKLLQWAIGELGVAEATGNNDGEPMRRYMNGERMPGSKAGWPWCAAFVVAGCKAVGEPLPGATTRAKERALWSAAAMELELAKAGAHVELERAKGGDLVFFTRGDRLVGHVGIVERVEVSAAGRIVELHTIEGNFQNKVARVTRKHALVERPGKRPEWVPFVLSYRWPLDPAKPLV